MEWFEKLKVAREVLGLTLRQVEEKTGISNAYISQIENGQISDPSFFKMVKILGAYKLLPSDIIEGKHYKK